jgi:hypothetical protein
MRLPVRLPKLVIILFILLSIWLFLENFHYGAYFEVRSLTYAFFSGYFTDIVQPLGLYFILCLFEPWLVWMRPWWVKTLVVFLIPSAMEILQGFGLNVLGLSFDPFDLLAYAIGGLLAALVERQVLARLGFWQCQKKTEKQV